MNAGTPHAYVFISYATADQRLANRIVQYLEQHAIKCWISSRDLKLADTWRTGLKRALVSSNAVLVLLTETSNKSPEVAREVAMATEARKPVLPVVLSDFDLSEELQYPLALQQRLYAKDRSEGEILDLLRHGLDEILRREAPTPAPRASETDVLIERVSLPTDWTLWRVYTSKGARAVVFAFYGLTALLPKLPLDEQVVDFAPYVLAFVAGMTIVGVTKQVNVPVLFTVGVIQPVFMLVEIAMEDLAFVIESLGANPPIPYGLACAAGGLLMSSRFGALGAHALSLGDWFAWIAPAWGILRRAERLETIAKILLVGIALIMMYLSF